jgi:hypothetical protein
MATRFLDDFYCIKSREKAFSRRKRLSHDPPISTSQLMVRSARGAPPVLQRFRTISPAPVGILTTITGLPTNPGRFPEDVEMAICNALVRLGPYFS